jgi:hypothetical protein
MAANWMRLYSVRAAEREFLMMTGAFLAAALTAAATAIGSQMR